MDPWHMWLIAGIILIIIEIFTPGFVLASFGIGCLFASLLAYLEFGIYTQLISFSIGTLIVFFGIRPLFLKYVIPHSDPVPTNVGALIGKTGLVIEKIESMKNTGRVKIGGEDWKAITEDDSVIEVDQKIEIIKVDGAKVIVKKL